MTINSLSFIASTPVAGLGTQTFNVPATGLYTVGFKIFVPFAQGTSGDSTSLVGQSGLQVVVALNAVTKLTVGGSATNPTPTQPIVGGSIVLQCTASDVLTVVLSSVNAVDAAPNAVKGIINIFAGE